MPEPGQTITIVVLTEFDGDLRVYRPVGDDLCDYDLVKEVRFPGCTNLGNAVIPDASGTYLIYVAPSLCAADIFCNSTYSNYYLWVMGQTPTGACCMGTTCEPRVRSECVGEGAFYFGDGVDCGAITCYACPPNMEVEPEIPCPESGHADEVNGGCSESFFRVFPLQPSITSQGICGTLSTFTDDPPRTPKNRRDEDWYGFNLTGAPVGDPGRLSLELYSEIPIEVLVYDAITLCNPDRDEIYIHETLSPGTVHLLERCIRNRPALYDVYIVIRPAAPGTPRELPCGSRYWLRLAQSACADTGACCIVGSPGGANCAVMSNFACSSAGGVYKGAGTTCSDVACVCVAGDPREVETSCFSSNPNNNGCDSSGTPTFDTRILAPGSAICGRATRSTGFQTDTDWFVYQHPGGFVRAYVTGEPPMEIAIIEPGPTGTPAQRCAASVLRATAAAAELEVASTFANLPAGAYWIRARVALSDPTWPACDTNYRAWVVTSGPTGGCCVAGICEARAADECAAVGGHFLGVGQQCQAACPACPGDMDCDGAVTFGDIERFIAALSITSAACWPHDCPWNQADLTVDGLVTFADIDPFVSRIGATCP